MMHRITVLFDRMRSNARNWIREYRMRRAFKGAFGDRKKLLDDLCDEIVVRIMERAIMDWAKQRRAAVEGRHESAKRFVHAKGDING